jgi:hypothetical protein
LIPVLPKKSRSRADQEIIIHEAEQIIVHGEDTLGMLTE